MSLPRELSLSRNDDGLRLIQQPARELKKIRGDHFIFRGGTVAEANNWIREQVISGDKLQIEVAIKDTGTNEFGLDLLKGESEVTKIRCEPARLVLDRTHSGKSNFHSNFAKPYEAPLTTHGGRTRLNIFVDTSSVEIFANGGEALLTALVLPGENSRDLEFWSSGDGTKIERLEIWKMNSVW
jgi:sucrose-6-phosphate hydrolase SacC (GH32 family)